MPFSAGPRGCLGQRLAELEMGLILAPLLQRFDLAPTPAPAPAPAAGDGVRAPAPWGAEGVWAELVVVLRPAGPGTLARVCRRPV